MWQVCPTALGAGPADESIMRLTIDETKCTHVLCKRSRAAVRQSDMINSIRARCLPLQVTQRALCYWPFQEKKHMNPGRLQGLKHTSGKEEEIVQLEMWGQLKT